MKIADLIEENTVLKKFGIFMDVPTARVKVVKAIERNNDDSKCAFCFFLQCFRCKRRPDIFVPKRSLAFLAQVFRFDGVTKMFELVLHIFQFGRIELV